MLSQDPQTNNSVFAAIHVSVRTNEVFSEHGLKCIVYTLYILSLFKGDQRSCPAEQKSIVSSSKFMVQSAICD